jgi:hypothetical protein
MAILQDGWMFRLPVASARHGDFIQAEPRHENAWASGSQTHLIRKVEKTYRIGSVSDPVGSAFKLGLDPGSGSVFGIRIRIPDPGSKNRLKKLKFTRTDLNDENRKML